MKLFLQHIKEVSQRDDIDNGELCLAQHVKVSVVGYNVTGIGSNSAVNKLVVVRVGNDKIKTILRGNEFHIRTLQECLYYHLCRMKSKKSAKDFRVFFKNLICYAQDILTAKNGVQHAAILTVAADTLYKTIGVKNYSHGNLHSFIKCLLLSQPLMKIHVVDFVEALLSKYARIPQFFEFFIHLLNIVITDELLDFVQLLIAFNARKQIQQIKLCRIENCRLYVLHKWNTFVICGQRYELILNWQSILPANSWMSLISYSNRGVSYKQRLFVSENPRR